MKKLIILLGLLLVFPVNATIVQNTTPSTMTYSVDPDWTCTTLAEVVIINTAFPGQLQEGDIALTTSDGKFWIYQKGSWGQFFPQFSGTVKTNQAGLINTSMFPAPFKVPIADSTGKLASGWINAGGGGLSADLTAALVGTSGTPNSVNRFVTNADGRMTDSRTPLTHSHAESDVTNLTTDLAGKLASTHASLQTGVHGISIASGKTLTVNNSVTLAGTDATTITLPATTGTLPLNNQTMYIGTTGVAINRSSGALTLAGLTFTTPVIGAATGTSLAVTGNITSSGGALGYATGNGGTVTQATSKATGVTLSKYCGTITTAADALASSTSVSFTVTNTLVTATDVVHIQHDSGGTLGAYFVTANTMAAGSYKITIRNLTGGSLSEAIVIRFVIIRGVAS